MSLKLTSIDSKCSRVSFWHLTNTVPPLNSPVDTDNKHARHQFQTPNDLDDLPRTP